MELTPVLFTIGVSFLLAVLFGPISIPILRRMKFGQQVRDDGPQAHLKKMGTPTMGGIIILLAMSLAFIRFTDTSSYEFYILIIGSLGFGLIGFLDDFIKIRFKRSLGLTAKQKLVGQLLVSLGAVVLLIAMGQDTAIYVPGTSLSLDLGWFYYLLVIIVFWAATNAVNITDGLDGLLSGTSAITFGAFAIIALMQTDVEASFFSAAMIGAVLGFLVFNAHPAKVFMGDTGSLGIGGGLAAVAILTKTELLLVIIGGVYVVEMLSVIIQVISFKTRGKRVFKMAPIHHHFELSGWSEWRVVITLWVAALVCAGVGLYLHEGLSIG
jgi:phospho-N-acetylmuramoyl-pentapeptide-transferase